MADNVDLIISERLTDPSKVTPTLFVGLGGCGLRIVQRVKQHLQQRDDYEERYKALTKFAAIDTNINDLERARQDMDDVFLLSDFDKEGYARLAHGQMFLEPDEHFTQWVPENYRFRAGDTAGAGQIRIESRLGLYYQTKHRDLLMRFRQLLERLKDHSHGHRRLDSQEIRIVLCYSVAGGTGSGAHLPMAYILRDMAQQLGQPRLYGVSVLPSVFEDKTGRNKDGIFANGYAALKELEHLMKLGAPESMNYPVDGLDFHYNGGDPTKRKVRQQPFDFVYVIDRPERFSVSNVVAAAADGLYLQMFSPLFGEQAGDYDNYTQHQRFLVPHDFSNKGVRGFTSFYGSYGSAVMLVPTQGLIQYCAQAAALDVLRSSFVTQIPSGTQYLRLRNEPDTFHRATFVDSEDEQRTVHSKDLRQLSERNRNLALRSLYTRRIRLLARADYEARHEQTIGEFREIWRHGHGVKFEAPPLDPNELGEHAEKNIARRMDFERSIVGAIEHTIGEWAPETPRKPTSHLLHAAQRELEKSVERILSEHINPSQLKTAQAAENAEVGIREDIRRARRRVEQWMVTVNTTEFVGIDRLLRLNFVDGVDLRAQRYAFINLLDHPSFQWAREANRDAQDSAESQNYRDSEKDKKFFGISMGTEQDEQAAIDNEQALRSSANDALQTAKTQLDIAFAKMLTEVHERFTRYEEQLASMEHGFDAIEKERSRRLAHMRREGDDQTNQYILDGEALQLPNGRRLWDYYYEDRHAGREELRINDPRINELLTARFVDRARDPNSKAISGRSLLYEVLDSIEQHVARILTPELEGVPGHQDSERRNGYTLDKALIDELQYRALHLSNSEDHDTISTELVRDATSRFKALTVEERESHISLSNVKNSDYLRDKFKRIIGERAQLLCFYDESRDQQGGVRPCRIFMGSLHNNLRNTEIGGILTRGELVPDTPVQWIDDPNNGMRQIVFYRSVLNVPLYVFGRMNEMKNDYHAFRNLSKRPKVLHIDKNWEYALQDLDPEAAVDFQRKENLRKQIIGFAALFTAHHQLDGQEPIITQLPSQGRNDESYWILRPLERSQPSPDVPRTVHREIENGEQHGDYQKLGQNLRDAINNLPDTVHNNPLKYEAYIAIMNGVRGGEAPRLLQEVWKQAIDWRQQHDSRRERYGRTPDERQTARLNDLEEAWTRLAEALKELHDELKEEQDEYATGQVRISQANAHQETRLRAITDSVQTLDDFAQKWAVINNPDEIRGDNSPFASLFGPLSN